MLYRIADFYFDIRCRHAETEAYLADFLCADAPRTDLAVAVSDAEIEAERAAARRNAAPICSEASFESLAIYRKICAFALAHDAFLMHGAVIAMDGRGYAFAAKSGTGKTTHIRLWMQAFGDRVRVINGDKPILRLIDGTFYAYGTPWNGKERFGCADRVPLFALCFLRRGETNTIHRISDEEAVPLLFSQIMIGDSTDLARQLELADELLRRVPLYRLACNMEPEAALVAWRGMADK